MLWMRKTFFAFYFEFLAARKPAISFKLVLVEWNFKLNIIFYVRISLKMFYSEKLLFYVNFHQFECTKTKT